MSGTRWGAPVGYGWEAPEKVVCADCLGEEGQEYFWEEGAGFGSLDGRCDYCDRATLHSGPLRRVVELVAPALHRYFNDPGDAGAIRDEGEWLIDTIGTEEALRTLWPSCGVRLLRDIAGAFRNSRWVPCNGHFLEKHESEQFTHKWHHFERMAKHRTRYFLDRQDRQYGDDPWMEYPSPSEFLARIGEFAEDQHLVRPIDTGQPLFRVRCQGVGESFDTFDELGPPPGELAAGGRMNPAGIAYLYLARELPTAVAEVVKETPAHVAVGEFRPKPGLSLLDLTRLPESPSIFDDDAYDDYQSNLFLRDFAEQISKPVPKDGREHLEYVPSQVVCEFFAQVFGRGEGQRRVGGIAYRSSVVDGGENVVIFPPETGEKWEDLAELVSTQQLRMDDWSGVTHSFWSGAWIKVITWLGIRATRGRL